MQTYYIIYFILPVIIGMGTYIVRTILSRIEILEDKMQHSLSESQTRQLLSDKLEPVETNIAEIKVTLDKLYDLYLNSFRPKND